MQQTPDMMLTAALAQYPDWHVMRDVLIPADDKTMHIDFLIVAQYGIFTGELKTFQGTISGIGMNKYWKHYVSGHEIDYFSPILQNLYHIKYLREFLAPVPYDIHIHSIVVMHGLTPASRFQIQAPYPPDTSIVTNIESFRRVTQAVRDRDKMWVTEAEAQYLYDYIGENQLRGEAARTQHAMESADYKQNARKALAHQLCPECFSPLVPRSAADGNYLVCSRYPDCLYAHRI